MHSLFPQHFSTWWPVYPARSDLVCQWLQEDVQRCENKRRLPREPSTHSYLTLRWAHAWPVCKAARSVLVEPQPPLWLRSSGRRTASPHERSADATLWTLQRVGKQEILLRLTKWTNNNNFTLKQRPAQQTLSTIHWIIFLLIRTKPMKTKAKKRYCKNKYHTGSNM